MSEQMCEQRRERLRALMREQGIEALLISHAANRYYLSGFELHDVQLNESAGRLIVMADGKDWILTDSRYLDAARRQLCDRLSSYAGFTRSRLVVVFDGYKQKGSPGEKSQFHNIQVVYTKEGQTADAYIEALAHEIGRDYAVRVASSDGLVQLSSFGSGVLRMSARELHEEVEAARLEMQKHYRK